MSSLWFGDCRRPKNTGNPISIIACVFADRLFVIQLSTVNWSVHAEPGSGGIQRHARNRLTQIQSWFRRSPLWGFWSLNRLLYSTLFFKNLARRKAGIKTASAANDPDAFTRYFGTAQPSSIPESTGASNIPHTSTMPLSYVCPTQLVHEQVLSGGKDSRRSPLTAQIEHTSPLAI